MVKKLLNKDNLVNSSVTTQTQISRSADNIKNNFDDLSKIVGENSNECANDMGMEKASNDKTAEFASNNSDANDDLIMLSSNFKDDKIKLIKSTGDRLSYYLVQEISLAQYDAFLIKKNQNQRSPGLLSIKSTPKVPDHNYFDKNSSSKREDSKDEIKDENNRESDNWKLKNLPFVKLSKLFVSKQGIISVTSVTEAVNKKVEILSRVNNNNTSFKIIKRRTKLIRSRKKDFFSAASTRVSDLRKDNLKKNNWSGQSNEVFKLESDDVKGFLEDINDIKRNPEDESMNSPEDIKSNLIQGYQCDICKKTFSKVESFTKHIRIHTESSFVCADCSKSYKHPCTLKNHILTIHNRPLRIETSQKDKCSYCPFRLVGKNKARLLAHERVHFRTEGRYTCNVCNAKYNMHHWYLKHELSHQ